MALPDDDAGENGDHGEHAGRERQQQAEAEEARDDQPEAAALEQCRDLGRIRSVICSRRRGGRCPERLGCMGASSVCLRMQRRGDRQGRARRFSFSADSTRLFRCSPGKLACKVSFLAAALEVDDRLERVVVNLGGAEVGVALGFALGQFHLGDAGSGGILQCELDLVAIEIIAFGEREARPPACLHPWP